MLGWIRRRPSHRAGTTAPRASALLGGLLLELRATTRAPATLDWYEQRLRRFVDFLGDPPADRISAEDIRRFLIAVKTGTSGVATSDLYVESFRKAISSLFTFALRNELVLRSPMSRVAKLRLEHRELAILTPSDVEALIAAQPERSPLGLRNRAMIAFLYDTGVRVGELVGIRIEDLDLAALTCRVRGKTGEGSVPLSFALRQMLLQYLERGRPRLQPFADSGHLFLGRRGLSLRETAVNQWLRKSAARAGIVGKRVSPHTFRHSFATAYLRNGGDAFTLQRILRHRTSDMVRRYVHVAMSDVRERHRAASPLERITRGG